MSDFVVGGPVPLDSEAYAAREFEQTTYSFLTSNNWVLLLGPRQHGKTSALARLEALLRDNGVRTARVDFQSFGAPDDYADLLRWFSARVARAFETEPCEPAAEGWEDLEAWLEANSPAKGSLAILVDEAGAVPDAWQNRFYSQLRALYNRRADAPPEAFARRAVFLFAGTFRPEQLINDDNSPFNVSREVRTEDLTLEQATCLATQIAGPDLEQWARAAFDVVGGQPYLLQMLLAAAATGVDDAERQGLFDGELERLRSGREQHIVAVFARALAEPRLAELLVQVASDPDGIPFNPTDGDQLFLEVLGPAAAVGGRLRMRNRLYGEIVRASPQFAPETTQGNESQFIVPLKDPVFAVMIDAQLRQFADENFAAAVTAHNEGHHRLALAGFGSVLEAILLDHLLSLEDGVLETARTAVEEPPPGEVKKWKFYKLTQVAHKTEALANSKLALSDALRDWRNLIHPAVAMDPFLEDSAMGPEAQVGAGVIQLVLRDLALHAQ